MGVTQHPPLMAVMKASREGRIGSAGNKCLKMLEMSRGNMNSNVTKLY